MSEQGLEEGGGARHYADAIDGDPLQHRVGIESSRMGQDRCACNQAGEPAPLVAERVKEGVDDQVAIRGPETDDVGDNSLIYLTALVIAILLVVILLLVAMLRKKTKALEEMKEKDRLSYEDGPDGEDEDDLPDDWKRPGPEDGPPEKPPSPSPTPVEPKAEEETMIRIGMINT